LWILTSRFDAPSEEWSVGRLLQHGIVCSPMVCCQVASVRLAEVSLGGDSVAVSRCRVCRRMRSIATGTSPHWVQARARRFHRMRFEAFGQAGLPLPPN
jgi:hypothetical protein